MTLLVLSRAYTLQSALAAANGAPAGQPNIHQALQPAIKDLPEAVVKEVELGITESSGVDAREKRVRVMAAAASR